MENTKVEHVKFGSGTIVGYVPSKDKRSEPKLRIRFDTPATSAADTAPKLLSLPAIFENGLLTSLMLPAIVADSFRAYTTQKEAAKRGGFIAEGRVAADSESVA